MNICFTQDFQRRQEITDCRDIRHPGGYSSRQEGIKFSPLCFFLSQCSCHSAFPKMSGTTGSAAFHPGSCSTHYLEEGISQVRADSSGVFLSKLLLLRREDKIQVYRA